MLELKDGSFNIPSPHDQQIQNEDKVWTPPQEGFLKLHFDGSSKGNLEKASAGGVIRDSSGKIICLYVVSIGNTTNNAAEFGVLEQGLEILIRKGHVNVTVEGDSALVIRIVKILQCGTNIGKVIKQWCLAQISKEFRSTYKLCLLLNSDG